MQSDQKATNQNSEQKIRHVYLRDYSTSNKTPVGCVAMKIDRVKNQISYAVSCCNPSEQKKFNPRIAVEIATGRLGVAAVVIQREIPKTSHEITKLVMEDIIARNFHDPRRQKPSDAKPQTRSYVALQAALGWVDYSAKFDTRSVAA